jgi:hypothetical protein
MQKLLLLAENTVTGVICVLNNLKIMYRSCRSNKINISFVKAAINTFHFVEFPQTAKLFLWKFLMIFNVKIFTAYSFFPYSVCLIT